MKKIIMSLASICVLFSFLSCGNKKAKMGKTWKGESVVHKGFTDLGNFIIQLPDYNDPAVHERGLKKVNARYDHGDISRIGCTAMVSKNSKGEVLFGRNMDVEISSDPAYVYTTSYGKYKNFCVTYAPGVYKHYVDIQKDDDIDQDFKDSLIFQATDAFNEKGLYVEANMRSSYKEISNYGIHSARGETTRSDGKKWSELRACTFSIVQLATQNCATVKEMIEYLKNSYDFYTIGLPDRPHYDGWNMCFLVGDATGEYGLVEIVQDEVFYIPYQYGQANYYITPKLSIFDTIGSGYGRLAMVQKVIGTYETLEGAMDAMKAVQWRNETLWIGESERADSKSHPNIYNQIIFKDDKGNPQLDWRSDYVKEWPVLDDGRMIVPKSLYTEACTSDYDVKIKKFFDDAISTGRLILDDGSIRFKVEGKNLTLSELKEKHEQYELYALEPEKQKAFSPYYEEYERLLLNQNSYWTHVDKNFEALKAMVYNKIHTRYNDEGKYDKSSKSKYEKLLAYYGYGVPKDESFLRKDASIWTTSLNVGVNCANKQIKVRFWENDDVVYFCQF